MSTDTEVQTAPAQAQPVDQAAVDPWVRVDLAYNAAKPGTLQRAADNAMRHEIMLRVLLREVG